MACATCAAPTNARTRTPRPGPSSVSGVSFDGGSEPRRPRCWPAAPPASDRNRRSRRRSRNPRNPRNPRRSRNRRSRDRSRDRSGSGNLATRGPASGTLRRGCASGAAPSGTARTAARATAAGPYGRDGAAAGPNPEEEKRMSRSSRREQRLRLFRRGNDRCPICLTPFTESDVEEGETVTLVGRQRRQQHPDEGRAPGPAGRRRRPLATEYRRLSPQNVAEKVHGNPPPHAGAPTGTPARWLPTTSPVR